MSSGRARVKGPSVTITLPLPYLGQSALNEAETTVTRSDGLATSLGLAFSGSDDDKQAYLDLGRLIYDQTEAQAPGLITNAEENIQSFISALLSRVGILHVVVKF